MCACVCKRISAAQGARFVVSLFYHRAQCCLPLQYDMDAHPTSHTQVHLQLTQLAAAVDKMCSYLCSTFEPRACVIIAFK